MLTHCFAYEWGERNRERKTWGRIEAENKGWVHSQPHEMAADEPESSVHPCGLCVGV